MSYIPPPQLAWLLANCVRCRSRNTAKYLAMYFNIEFFWLLDGYCLACHADLGIQFAKEYNARCAVNNRLPLVWKQNNICPKCRQPEYSLAARGGLTIAGSCMSPLCSYYLLSTAVQQAYRLEKPWKRTAR